MRRNRELHLIDVLLALLVTGGAYACTGTWSPAPGIELQSSPWGSQVGVGGVWGITLAVIDNDTFTPDGGSPYPVASSGPFFFHWSAGAGTFDQNDFTGSGDFSHNVCWTAPVTPGIYNLTLSVTDVGTDQGPPGTSIDPDPKVEVYQVEVMPREWGPCPDLWGSAAASDDKVQVGHDLTLTASCDGDTDNWASGPQGNQTYGTGQDTVTYT